MAAVATAQCSASDNSNCANWARNGFCTNAAYSKSMIQLYCPRTCPNSGCVATTVKSSAENVNCGKWANEPTAVFCASPVITTSMKSFYCPTTCASEIVVKTVSKTTSPLSATKTGATTTNKHGNSNVLAHHSNGPADIWIICV